MRTIPAVINGSMSNPAVLPLQTRNRGLPCYTAAMSQHRLQQQTRINDALYQIHRDLSAPLSATALARTAAYSPHHFHRVFKQVTGENVNDYIRRTRLEHAASLLVFNPALTVTDVALRCGFQSPSSFTHAFRAVFGESPGRWRQGGYNQFVQRTRHTAADPELAAQFALSETRCLPDVCIEQLPDRRVAYLRHRGYNRSIAGRWHYLRSWCSERGLDWQQQQMIGLYHSNPTVVPLDQCHYVACVTVPEHIFRSAPVAVLTIPGGSYATVRIAGQYGELLPMMQRLLQQWLPDSGYRLGSTPPLAHYHRNHFMEADECFDLTLAVPVQTD